MDIFWLLAYGSLLFLVLKYLYRYLTKPFEYWKDRGVPSAPAIPIIGSLYEDFTQELHVVHQKRYKKYGRIHGFYESNRPVLSVGDPDLLKDIFLKDFQFFVNRRRFTAVDSVMNNMIPNLDGEEWKRVRTIVTPAFSSGKIKKMSLIMLEAADATLKNFEKYGEEKKAVDFRRVFGAFSMDVIARSAFGTIVDSHNDPENIFVRHAKKAFMEVNFNIGLFLILPKIHKLLKRSIFPKDATNFFGEVTLNIIKQRRATGQKQNDFLQLMMDEAEEMRTQKNSSTANEETIQEDESEKSINDLGHDRENKKVFQFTKKYKGLSHDELLAQCIIFFFAGYETTASALSFASYLLALNPECQETLIKEIDETLRKNQKNFTYEEVQSMKYLDNVVWETLRIFPPATVIERRAQEDYELGETGIKIPKGMVISVPVYPIHHDPEFYENPEKFDPNRFSQEEKDKRNPYSFIPFGVGPRNCIGMRFALIEIKFGLVALFSKFRVKRCPETKVPLEFRRQAQGLMQPKAILLHVERRKDSVI